MEIGCPGTLSSRQRVEQVYLFCFLNILLRWALAQSRKHPSPGAPIVSIYDYSPLGIGHTWRSANATDRRTTKRTRPLTRVLRIRSRGAHAHTVLLYPSTKILQTLPFPLLKLLRLFSESTYVYAEWNQLVTPFPSLIHSSSVLRETKNRTQ